MALKCMKYLKHRLENCLKINATVALGWKKLLQFAFFIALFTKNVELKRSDEKINISNYIRLNYVYYVYVYLYE